MQAQRRPADPAQPLPLADTEGWAPSSDASTVSDKSSPAHLMLRDLASRLAEATPAAAIAAPAEEKWPMPARIGAIVGLGLLCWAGLLWVTVQTI